MLEGRAVEKMKPDVEMVTQVLMESVGAQRKPCAFSSKAG
jgi:hypothetical protein